MPSPESVEIRRHIVRDAVPAGVSIQEERQQWEAFALTLPLAPDTRLRQDQLWSARALTTRA